MVSMLIFWFPEDRKVEPSDEPVSDYHDSYQVLDKAIDVYRYLPTSARGQTLKESLNAFRETYAAVRDLARGEPEPPCGMGLGFGAART